MLASRWFSLLVVATLGLAAARPATACPFCSAVSLTFCEEVAGADVAVIAKLVKLPPDSTDSKNGLGTAADTGKAKFEIVEVLKGQKELTGVRSFETLYFGKDPVGTHYLVMGVEPPQISWTTPIAISDRGREYLDKALKLPKEGADRLAFFQDYLEDADEMLGRDAYDEFAKTPYAGVKDLKDRMPHDKLVAWIQDPKLAPSRRRLYLTMLGVCGKPEDAALFEKMLRSDDRQVKQGLDALVAAYLSLQGPAGMQLIEDLFLKNKDADYVETYSTIMALRFHGQEEKVIPRERLLEGLRYMLDRPQLADQVIPDLARWQDWSSMEPLVALFKNADDDSIWVRVPVINYLRQCPLPKAKEYLKELAEIDPDAVKKANNFFPAAAPAAAEKTPADAPASTDKPAAGEGKKVSAPAPTGRKTTQANKPVIETETASAADDERPPLAANTRLSRAAAPAALSVPQIGTLHVLGWMSLAGAVVFVFLLAIVRGGQDAT